MLTFIQYKRKQGR
jgi:hypothetical protein